jgi:hypothetical protein
MNNRMTVVFPGGAGGAWLSYLIYCLKKNYIPESQLINFHKTSKGCPRTHDTTDKSFVYLNGTGLFNMFLNVVFKLRVHDHNITSKPISDQFEIFASEASSKLFFLDERTDLNWDNLFLNSTLFVEELFSIMDSYNIVYNKNPKICQIAIENYKNTCINPMEYYDRWDNIYWLGWCNGISKHLWGKWPIANSIEEMQEFLYPNKDFYTEFTLRYIVDVKNDKF